MITRRENILGLGIALAANALALAKRAKASDANTPELIARDEAHWADIAKAYSLDDQYIILNGGGNNPHPQAVTQKLAEYDRLASSAPRPHNYIQLAQKEEIRPRLAEHFGCDPQELAITRNTTEGLNIVGWGLDLQAGDEILISNYDTRYAGAIFAQRAARHGVIVKTVELPISPSAHDVVSHYAAMMTNKTKLLVASHLADGWGFVLPIKELSDLAHQNNAQMLADGALTFGHIPINVRDLKCDYYATSLHKHLTAPLGTGALYVRKDRLESLWPLYGVRRAADDIRKFETIGTRSGPTIAAIATALDFYEQVGPANKAARMRYLAQLVENDLKDVERVQFITEKEPSQRTGLARVALNGVTGLDLTSMLREEFGIYTYGNFPGPNDGVYISPNLFNTPHQMSAFSSAIRAIAARG